MSYIFVLIGFLCFTTIAFFIEKRLAEKLKRYSFLCSLSVIPVLLYYGTFTINFFTTQYLIWLFSAYVLVQEGFKNKFSELKEFFRKHRGFFTLSLIWYILTIFAYIQGWDDFSWASFVKHLNQYGVYWNSNSAILGVGIRYFPGISLWESFFTGHNFYAEQPLFFAVGLTVIATFHACIPADLKGKKWFYFLVLFLGPVSWLTQGIGNISSEILMGMLLGAALFSTLDIEESKDLFVPFSMVVFLAITKETGFLLALLVVFLIVVRIIRKKLFATKWLTWSVVTLLIMAANFIFWQIYLKKDPAPVAFNTGDILNMLKQDLVEASPKTKMIINSFFHASVDRMMGRSFLTRFPVFEFLKGFFLLWVIIITAVLIFVRKWPEYLITFYWGLIGYSSVILINFLYMFTDYEGTNLASYERYLGLYLLAFFMLVLKVIYNEELYKKKTFLYVLTAFMLIYPPSPRIVYPPSIKHYLAVFVPEKYKHKLDKDVREELTTVREKIYEFTPDNSSVWLIWQNSNGLQAMVLRYEIAPRKMNNDGWSMGPKYHPVTDLWSENLKLKDFTDRVGKFDYMAMGFVDEQFIRLYGSLFTTVPRTGYLYKNESKDGVARWVEFK